MLEVVFNDSAKGGLKCAMNYHEEAWIDGPVSFIGERHSEEEIRRMYAGKAVGGNAADVVGLSFMLDIGDISGDVCGSEREMVIRKMYGFAFDEREDREFRRFVESSREDLARVKKAAEAGETIRIWRGESAQDACGLRHLLWEIRSFDCEVLEVPLPRLSESAENEVREQADWGSVLPGQFYRFLSGSGRIPTLIRRRLAGEWAELVRENATLRAVINGQLMGVPEDFYDPLLLGNMPDDAFHMARLLGNVLGKYDIGVGDCWYAERIRKMIASGKLSLVSAGGGDHPYSLILRKK